MPASVSSPPSLGSSQAPFRQHPQLPCIFQAVQAQQEEQGSRAGAAEVDASWTEGQQRTSRHNILLLLSIPGQARTPGQFKISPIPFAPFLGWVTLPGLGMGEMQKGCQSCRHLSNTQPSIPRQSELGQGLARVAVHFEAMPALAP